METVFKYNRNPIPFNKEKEVWINATEMSRPFRNKPVAHFLEDPSRLRIVLKLCTRNSLNINDIDMSMSLSISNLAEMFPESVKVAKGGIPGENTQGTWFQEDIALEFARWLSPDFAIWCNDRIKELLTVGMTALPQTLEEMIDNPDLVIGLATKLKEERAKVALLTPKAALADQLVASPEMFTMEQVAKMLFDKYKIGRNRLFEALRKKKVLTLSNLPTQRYMNKGYFYVREERFGSKIKATLYVYNKGIEEIMRLLNIDGYQQELKLTA